MNRTKWQRVFLGNFLVVELVAEVKSLHSLPYLHPIFLLPSLQLWRLKNPVTLWIFESMTQLPMERHLFWDEMLMTAASDVGAGCKTSTSIHLLSTENGLISHRQSRYFKVILNKRIWIWCCCISKDRRLSHVEPAEVPFWWWQGNVLLFLWPVARLLGSLGCWCPPACGLNTRMFKTSWLRRIRKHWQLKDRKETKWNLLGQSCVVEWPWEWILSWIPPALTGLLCLNRMDKFFVSFFTVCLPACVFLIWSALIQLEDLCHGFRWEIPMKLGD